MHQIEEIAKARLAEQSEITALREKLAAAEASLAERGRMLELANRVQRSYRATVAAALAELRAHWNVQYQDYVSKTDDGSWERRQELLTRMGELEFIIAKLDLPEAAPASWKECRPSGASDDPRPRMEKPCERLSERAEPERARAFWCLPPAPFLRRSDDGSFC